MNMKMQAVLYKNNEHMDTDFFDDFKSTLRWVREHVKFIDSFNIYACDGSGDIYAGNIVNGKIVCVKHKGKHAA